MVVNKPVLAARAGEDLRTERVRRKMPLSEVARQLHIPVDYIKALEAGDLSVFTAEVYACGAYRKYTKFLGMRRPAGYHVFLRSLSEARKQTPLTVPLPPSWRQRWLNPLVVLAAGVVMGVLVVAGYLVWQVRSFVALPKLMLLEPQEAVAEEGVMMVRGRSEKGAHVTVNEVPVLLDDKAEFQMQLWLKPGINVLQVEARGVAGRARVVQRHILLPRS